MKKSLLQKIFVAFFSLTSLVSAAQNPIWAFPPNFVYQGNVTQTTNWGGIQTGPFGVFNVSLANAQTFGGLSPAASPCNYSSNIISDPSGNILAWIVDGNVLDKNGDFLNGASSDNDFLLNWRKTRFQWNGGLAYHCTSSGNTFTLHGAYEDDGGGTFEDISGYSEVCVVPNPANCQQYFIFTAGICRNPIVGGATAGIYQFTTQSFLPFYSVIDFSMTNGNGTPGKLLLFNEPNQAGSGPGFNCDPVITNVTNVTDQFNVKEMFTTLYGLNAPAKQRMCLWAATDVITGSGNPFNVVFQSNGEKIICLKLDGINVQNPYTVLNSGYQIPGIASTGLNVRAEMEVVKLANGNYRVAVPTGSSSGDQIIHIVDFDVNGNQVGTPSTITLPVGSGANSTAFLHGLEFSPDGKYLFFTHENGGGFTNQIDYVKVTGGTLSLEPAITNVPAGVFQSQIELNYSGGKTLLYFANVNNMVALDITNATPSNWTWPSANVISLGGTNYISDPFFLVGFSDATNKVFLMPDQIDGGNYLAPFQQTTCCYAYGAFDVKAGSPYTAQSGAHTWSPGVSNNPWNSTTGIINVNDNITIPAGSNITIKNMTFKFTPTAKVTVMAAGCAPACPNPNTCGNGGRLTLDNSVFTINNACEANKMWPGVEVFGFNAGGVCSQGTFANSPMGWMYMINNSKIEHAITGVRIGKTTGGLFGGGVLQTKNSRFENNQIDVDIRPCPNITANKTFFQSTIFQNTAALLDPSKNPITHVKSTDAIGINFYGCVLQNMYSQYYWASDGIQSNNSTIRISPLVTTFKNLRYGIWAQATPLSRTIYCNSAQFINNDVGAYLNVVDYATFYNNTFRVLDNNSAGNTLSGPLPYGVGLYLNNCTGFTVQGNTFQNNSVIPAVNSSYNYTFGCIVNNSALRYSGSGNINADNFIFKNTFKNINWGCQAQNTNYDMPNCQYPNGAGLKYYCNTFKSVIKDVEIGVSSGAIDYNQGYITGTNKGFASDNSFSKNNPNTFPWEYLHVNTPTPPVPVGCPSGSSYSPYFSLNYIWSNSLNTVVNPQPAKIDLPVGLQYVQSDDNACGANPYLFVINNPYTDLPTQITQLKSAVANISSQYDCGNAAGLLNLIASNGTPGTVKNQLSNCAPFLSDNVLISYVNNSHYPDGDKQVILSACSPLSSYVKLAVQNSSLSGGTKKAVSNQQTGTSPATMIQNQVSMLNSEIKWCYDEIIRDYLNDTITPGALDSARLWIKRSLNGGGYDGRKVRLELDLQDSAAAVAAYQSLVINEGTSSSNAKVHDALIKLHGKDIKQTLQGDATMYNTLQQVYADVSTPDARLLAQSLLSYVDNIQPTPAYELMPQSGNRYAAEEAQETIKDNTAHLIRCFPNPFDHSTTITAEVKDDASSALLVVYNLMGNQVAKYNLTTGSNTVTFSAEDQAQEILFCSLIIDGVKVKTEKLVLIK